MSRWRSSGRRSASNTKANFSAFKSGNNKFLIVINDIAEPSITIVQLLFYMVMDE